MKVFVDTSFWCALVNRRDSRHAAAVSARAAAEEELVTTTFVVAETTSFLASRGRPDAARDLLSQVRRPGWCEVVHPRQEMYDDAVRLVLRYTDKDFGLTDAISFVLMWELHIHEALTFDRHFAQLGFRMIP